jgi:hypothetical protein
MIKWVKELFKKKPQVLYNINHPDVAGKFELAFECNGRKYYRAVKDYYLPVGRYKFIDARLREADLRMTNKLLKDYIKELKKNLDGTRGTINLVKASNLLIAMETHADLDFEPETIERLAAVVYVDETEDLRDFDEKHGNEKIKFWKDNGEYSFFLTRPIGELLNLNDSLETATITYIQRVEEVRKNLTSELYNPSSESI